MNKIKSLAIILLMISGYNFVYADGNIGDSIHAVHYTINLDQISTADNTISGWTEITIVPKVLQINYIPLELMDLTVDSVLVNSEIRPFNHADHRLEISLENPVSINDTLTAKVYYHGVPFHEAWGGFHFSGDYAFNLGVGFESIPHNLGKTWFPCIDNFTDRATYDIIGTAETGKTVTSGGMLIDTINNGNNTTTWHWQINHPIPTYLASIAVGQYIEYKDIYYGIYDTIGISIFTRPSDTADIEGSFVNLHEIMNFFESHFGPYPFAKVGYTGTAIGAMEHASNIAYPHFAINGNTSYEYLYTHELSHMWFGDKVTCSTAEDMWLNEGWATFCEVYYTEILYDHNTFLNTMRALHKDVLQYCHIEDGGYWAVSNIPQQVTYGKTAYDKGGTVANTLRNYLGDSIFFNAITAFLENDSIKYTSRSSEELRDFLSGYTGQDLKPFFDTWVMTPGSPHFSIDSTNITETTDSYTIDLWFKQKFKGYDYLGDENRLEITFADEYFNLLTDTIIFSGKTGHSQKSYSKDEMQNNPVAVFLDLFERVNDATTDNFYYFAESEEYTFPETFFTINIHELNDSALLRVTHNWVEPDSLKIPIEGLTLSPYRHWKVEGVLPDEFDASGKFFYSTSSNLDNTLITSPVDSVVILYRENPSHDWVSVPQTRVGVWMVGNIIVDEIVPGEYTLAVWDTQLVDVPQKNDTDDIRIFPNPSNGKVNFSFKRKGNFEIRIFDENGRKLDDFVTQSRNTHWKIANSDSTGTLLIRISEGGKVIASKKVVIIN